MTELTTYAGNETGRADLLDTTTDSWVASVADVVKLAGYICDTDFVPNGFRGSAPATAAAILYGREIGVGPITALQTLHTVHGRVGMSAELMRARVLAAGHDVEVVESTAAVCRMRGRRRGSQTWTEVSWSKGDATTAGLRGDNWTKYPRAMLVARASAELCRLVFPDVTHGMSATEELDGLAADAGPAAPAATPPRRVRRGTLEPPAPEVVEPHSAPLPPVSAPPVDAAYPAAGTVPQTPPPPDRPRLTGDPQGPDSVPPVGVVPEPTAEPAGVVSETPPPGEGGNSAVAPPTPPPVVVPAGHPVPLPGETLTDTEQPLPMDMAPGDLEADPRAQAELRGEEPATPAQVRHVMVLLRKIGLGATREERLRITQAVIQRRVVTFAQLTITDASRLITTLLLASESTEPRDYLRWLVDEGHRVMDEADAAEDSGVGNE